MRIVLALALTFASLSFGQVTATDLKSVHKIFIDRMPNDLDQYYGLSS